MHESALQFAKFCVSKKGSDCITWMEKGLLQASESFLTMEKDHYEEKDSIAASQVHTFYSRAMDPKPVAQD